MRRMLILGAVLAASIGTARAQPWCMSYMPINMNGAYTLCPSNGSLDLHLTPEQLDYFTRRAKALVELIHLCGGLPNACTEAHRDLVPPPTPEAMQFLARFGFTEKNAR